ncbi:MAG: diaminopimelate epimerase [Thermoanaerobaculia bacterium]|nr:diaminopimelate epimerase [Thermoanaerobaculia bacterium]
MKELIGFPFAKLSGAGNDFIVFDHRNGAISEPAALTRILCLRRLSVGGDGLILIEDSSSATFRMRYFNADGSEADFCANGTRCAARFADHLGIADGEMTIETGAGVIAASVIGAEVELGLSAPEDWNPSRPLETEAEGTVEGACLKVGVPHYVVWREGEDFWTRPIDAIGSEIRRHHDLGGAGANVNFVRVDRGDALSVRTWERGVEGETLACGSGVVASTTAAAMDGKVRSPVEVRTRSGIVLTVSFELEGDRVGDLRLRGDARIIYESAIAPETLTGFDPDWVREPQD